MRYLWYYSASVLSCQPLLLLHSLATIVFLGILLVTKELGVHSLGRDVLCSLSSLNTVGVSLAGAVMGTSVLLLWVEEVAVISCNATNVSDRDGRTAEVRRIAKENVDANISTSFVYHHRRVP